MEDKTTTDVPVDNGVAEPTQPDYTEDTAAVDQTTSNTELQTETQSEPSEDEQLDSWAQNKGLQLDSDNARKAAKMAREAERAMHAKGQRASELEKSLTQTSDSVAEEVAQSTGQDPELIRRLQRVEVRDTVRDFYDQNPDARELETEMIEELGRRPHLAGDLDALYAVVKSKNLDAVKSQVKRETLQTLAQKQQAAVPTGNAVNSAAAAVRITPQNVDELVARNDLNWYRKNIDAINRAMAG